MTLPAAWTGRRREAGALPRLGRSRRPLAEWAIRRTLHGSEDAAAGSQPARVARLPAHGTSPAWTLGPAASPCSASARWASAAAATSPTWGTIDVEGATRQLDLCLDAGVTFVDTANVYSTGRRRRSSARPSASRRDRIVLATKARFPMGEGPNDAGPLAPPPDRASARPACAASARTTSTSTRSTSGTGQTPLEETLEALDTLVRSGKVRYVGCSNYSGWQMTKALGISDRARLPALRLPAGLLLPPSARHRVRDRPRLPRPGPRHPRLEPARGRPALGQVPSRAGGARGLPAPDGLGRAAGARRGGPLRHRRGARGDRRGARRLGRADRAGLVARPPGRHVADRRRPHGGAAGRQPRGRRRRARRASARGSTS